MVGRGTMDLRLEVELSVQEKRELGGLYWGKPNSDEGFVTLLDFVEEKVRKAYRVGVQVAEIIKKDDFCIPCEDIERLVSND